MRRLGYLALAAVVAQGVLGGLTVLFLLPTAVSVAHACLAQTFFCLTVALAVVTSPRWKDRAPASVRAAFSADPVARVAAATAAVVFLQLFVGAVMRHTKAGLAIPDFPLSLGRLVPPLGTFPVAIHFTHRVLALAVAVLVGICVARAFASGRRGLEEAAAWLAALVVIQIALGAATVLSGEVRRRHDGPRRHRSGAARVHRSPSVSRRWPRGAAPTTSSRSARPPREGAPRGSSSRRRAGGLAHAGGGLRRADEAAHHRAHAGHGGGGVRGGKRSVPVAAAVSRSSWRAPRSSAAGPRR